MRRKPLWKDDKHKSAGGDCTTQRVSKSPESVAGGHLTVKLRGRLMPPDWSRGCTLSSSTRGGTTEHHGTLQRLLAGGLSCFRLKSIATTQVIVKFSITADSRNLSGLGPYPKVISTAPRMLPMMETLIATTRKFATWLRANRM